MLHAFSRTELLIGKEGLKKLAGSRVAVFGIGGVGTFVVEGLVRSGVGKFILVDDDLVCLTNLNRQLHATHSTIGKSKVEVMKSRILDINPNAEVVTLQRFYLPSNSKSMKLKDASDMGLVVVGAGSTSPAEASPVENALTWNEFITHHERLEGGIDYIVDAIDTVSGKIDLIVHSKEVGIPIISSMGAGNKLNPAAFEVADISKTSVCPLARVIRQEMKKRRVKGVKVVYSKEEPLKPEISEENDCNTGCVCPKGSTRTCITKRQIPGSISFVPSVAGLILAGEVIKDLLATGEKK